MELSHPIWTGSDKTILCWVMEKAQLADHIKPRSPHSWSNTLFPFLLPKALITSSWSPAFILPAVFCLQKPSTRLPHLDLTTAFSIVPQPAESPNADASPYVHVHTQASPCEP